jgi:hypothetical protein
MSKRANHYSAESGQRHNDAMTKRSRLACRPQTPLERADDVIARKLAAASTRGDFGLHDP